MKTQKVPVDLPSTTPEALGVDSTPLIQLSQWIREQKLDVRSLLVVKDGKVIFERYGDELTRNHNYELYSVTKTVTALLTGILVGEGKLSPNDAVAPALSLAHPEFSQALADKDSLRLNNLLSMSSGLYYQTRQGTDPLYYDTPNRLQLAVNTQPKLVPGTRFDYTDVNPVLVGAMVSSAAHQHEDAFAKERLFEPLGMTHYRWTGLDGTGAVSGGWGLRLRAMDMAKLGQLMLDGGKWQGRQVVPQSWITQMATPSPAASDYGYYCWIRHIVEDRPEFGAMGFKGQFITVLPQENAVVVMTSLLPTSMDLRDSPYINLYRRMVRGYILPALHPASRPIQSAKRTAALRAELKLSRHSRGIPGTATAPNDTPEL
ncbi:beta-lactamase family protein [Neisseriaceae bacterium JH1-16]|nr:beta-lactamase family protein [Neisseriaceae bacterium JH1-16]